MALTTATYGKLLAKTLPSVIKTEEENERLIAELEKLDTSGHKLTTEEKKVAELITLLIRQYEEEHYQIGHAEPLEALKSLMESHNLRQKDLLDVFGASSVASAVLNGKRGISKAQAHKVAECFHVPISLFV